MASIMEHDHGSKLGLKSKTLSAAFSQSSGTISQ